MTATPPSSLPNGVDAEAVVAYVGRLAEDAPPDGTSFHAAVHWQGGFRNEIRVRDLAPTYADEPAVLGGTDTASNPVEQVLGALGSCLAIGYTAGATARGIRVEDLRIEVTGSIDLPVFFGLKAGHAGYQGIDVKVHLRADADPESIAELHEAVLRTSPVGHTLERPAAIRVELVAA